MSYTDEDIDCMVNDLKRKVRNINRALRSLKGELSVAADPFYGTAPILYQVKPPTPMEELIREKETDDANEMLAEITEDTRWKN